MALKQWVNLPKHEIFKDNAITTTDRCGAIAMEITVEKADQPLVYKLQVVPVGPDNVTYTPEEEQRNPNFKMTRGKVGVIDEKTIRVEDIQLPAAGGNKYKIEVRDANGNVVSSDTEIETWRRLYYQVVSMDDGKGNTVPSYSLSDMENDYKRYYVELSEKGVPKIIPFFKSIHKDNEEDFAKAVGKAYTLDKDYKPVGFVSVFSNCIANMKEDIFSARVQVGTPNPLCVWNSAMVMLSDKKYLWYGLDDIHDQSKKYLVSDLTVTHTDINGVSQSITISRSDIKVDHRAIRTYGGYATLLIRMTPVLQNFLNRVSGTIEFEVDVNVVKGFTNGFRWDAYGANLVTVARRVWFEDMAQQTVKYTWNHEVGHRLGMAAWGNSKYGQEGLRKKLPDGPSTLYGENRGVNDKGHQGPHCEKAAGAALTYDPITNIWHGTPGCVMFGANGTATAHAPKDYCGECQPIVKKLDLS